MSDAVPIPDGLLAEWCGSLSHGTEMPAEAYLPTGIATAASIVGPRLYIRWGPTRRERCNLWVLNVARSAIGRKTTGMSAAKWAAAQAAKVLGDQLRWYSAKRLSDAQLVVDLDVVGADTAKAQREEEAIAEAEKRKPRTIDPIHRRIPVAWLLGANEVAPLWGEGTRDWQQATTGFLLDVFDGEIVSRTRSTTVAEQETFVCAIGNIPPAELAARTTMATLTSGFAGRWLLMPSPGPTHPVSMPVVASNGSDPLAALAAMIEHLATMARDCPGVDAIDLWTPDARALRDDWYGSWWSELAGADPDSREAGGRADLFNRAQAHALKLGTIAAVCRSLASVDSLAHVRVEVEDVAWAQDVVDRSVAAMLDVVTASGGGAATPLGRVENRVERYLREHGSVGEAASVSLRDLSRATKASDSHADVVRALESLQALGKVEIADVPPGPKGGRPGRRVWLPEGS